MFKNVLRQIEKIVYRLKRNYGVTITFHRITATNPNVQTGALNPTEITFTIKRAIIAPMKILRDFVYDLSFVAANKNFTYGGYFDAGKRVMILDRKDLKYSGSNIVPTVNDHIVYDSSRYDFEEVHPTAEGYAYLIILKYVASIPET